MKCPNCGAETSGNYCGYCGSQMPEAEKQGIRCTRCGSANVTFKRENQGEIRGKNSKQVLHRTVGLCKDCGYTWRVAENVEENVVKPRKTWLWVLGWIFIFPLPLTILLLRKKNFNSIIKYAIIAAAWILYLIIAIPAWLNNDSVSDSMPASDVAVEDEESQLGDIGNDSFSEELRFTLSWNEVGEFGKETTMNDNTDMSTTFIAFSVPAGTYSVKNKAASGRTQVTVYSGIEFDGEWEQFTSEDCAEPIVVEPGDVPQEIEVKEGQFIKLSDGGTDIEFVLQDVVK